jgi:hypothetical protein
VSDEDETPCPECGEVGWHWLDCEHRRVQLALEVGQFRPVLHEAMRLLREVNAIPGGHPVPRMLEREVFVFIVRYDTPVEADE